MRRLWNNRIVARLTGGSLGTVFLLLALGARSVDFHLLLHGDETACSLMHSSAAPPGDSSDSVPKTPVPDRKDPLDPFCHAGFWHEIKAPELVLERALPADLSRLFSILLEGCARFSSGSPRAPPVLV